MLSTRIRADPDPRSDLFDFRNSEQQYRDYYHLKVVKFVVDQIYFSSSKIWRPCCHLFFVGKNLLCETSACWGYRDLFSSSPLLSYSFCIQTMRRPCSISRQVWLIPPWFCSTAVIWLQGLVAASLNPSAFPHRCTVYIYMHGFKYITLTFR